MAATRRLAAIMFTDMVGYTGSTQSDEAGTLELLKEQEALVRPIFAAHRGREIKSTGDGFLVEFESALHAVRCAIEIQERMHDRNTRPDARPIRLRVGVHLGDVEERGSDIFGDAVNIASRIEPLARPEGVCITGQVFDQVRNKIPNHLERMGPTTLKNVHVHVDVYRVVLPWDVLATSPRATSRLRLAVLPLANISPDPRDEYFADGLTEELISVLSKVRELRVIARTSVSPYKSGSKSVAQIAAELDVGTVLEGSVRKSGNRLRITLQLIDAGTQEHIWANTYDRELDDVFAIQSEIAEKTTSALRLELLGSERESIRRRPTSSIEAYNLYLRGLHAARQSTYESYAEAVKFFGLAVDEDPDFSLALSALANMYIMLAGETIAPSEAFPLAKELLAKALVADPNSSEAHTTRGNLAVQYEHDWELAEGEFRRAFALSPSDADAHFWYSHLLVVLQRFDEATEELRATIELDPLWKLPRYWLMNDHFLAGDFEAAVAVAREESVRDPADPIAHLTLGLVYARTGRSDDARREAELASGPMSQESEMYRACLQVLLGEPEAARRLIAEWTDLSRTKYVNPTWVAELRAALGEGEASIESLEKDAREGGTGTFWFYYQDPAFDSVRDDPRFRAMLERLKLPTGAYGRSR